MTANGRMGGKILADGLKAQGVDAIFGVPGESFLALLDGLYDQRDTIRFITCRQEGGAANMAETRDSPVLRRGRPRFVWSPADAWDHGNRCG